MIPAPLRSFPPRQMGPACDPSWTPTSDQGPVLQTAWATLERESGPLIGLIGTRGAGKTAMACRLAAMWLHRTHGTGPTWPPGEFVRYWRAWDLLEADRHERFDRTASDPRGLPLERCAAQGTQLLVLDEIQQIRDTAHSLAALESLVDRRYGAMLPTMVLGNLDPKGLVAMSSSLADRLREGSYLADCRWGSTRGGSL